MSNTTIKLRRLQKQQQSLIADPPANVMVKRDGDHNFYFCIYGLEGEYKGGFYYGLLQLHENYPFAAPKLYMYTPSGRFQINMPICTSFTNYHQQSWTSAWNVRSLLLGTVSFMTGEEGSYGCRNDSKQVRQLFANKSLEFNSKIKKFCEQFYEQLKDLKPPISQKILKQIYLNQAQNPQIEQLRLSLISDGENAIGLNENFNNDGERLIQNQQQNFNNRNKCKKILIVCSIAIPIIATVCYLVFR